MTTSPINGEPLALPTELIDYIRHLSEPIEKYTPYFDALFIKRRNHASFFRDLKSFRCQEHVVALLTTPSNSPDLDIKQLYRNCSKTFLESRFAHPWCRTTPGATKDGWFTAEWGRIKKQSDAKRKQEERLHRLLVPIWCGFRVRMMPSDEQMERFIAERSQAEQKERVGLGCGGAGEEWVNDTKEEAGARDVRLPSCATVSRDDALETYEQSPNEVPSSLHRNAEAFVSEDDDRIHDSRASGDSDGAATAAKMFIGVAATSFLAQNPRARKYLWKKLQKQSN